VLITELAKPKFERKSSILSLKKPLDGIKRSLIPLIRLGTISSILEPISSILEPISAKNPPILEPKSSILDPISAKKPPILVPKSVKPCVKDDILLLKPCVMPLRSPLIPPRMEELSKFPCS